MLILKWHPIFFFIFFSLFLFVFLLFLPADVSHAGIDVQSQVYAEIEQLVDMCEEGLEPVRDLLGPMKAMLHELRRTISFFPDRRTFDKVYVEFMTNRHAQNPAVSGSDGGCTTPTPSPTPPSNNTTKVEKRKPKGKAGSTSKPTTISTSAATPAALPNEKNNRNDDLVIYISDRCIDLYRLYFEVAARGGYFRVTQLGSWQQVWLYVDRHLAESHHVLTFSAENDLRSAYLDKLYAFEVHMRGGTHDQERSATTPHPHPAPSSGDQDV
jgi:hypothetical protein